MIKQWEDLPCSWHFNLFLLRPANLKNSRQQAAVYSDSRGFHAERLGMTTFHETESIRRNRWFYGSYFSKTFCHIFVVVGFPWFLCEILWPEFCRVMLDGRWLDDVVDSGFPAHPNASYSFQCLEWDHELQALTGIRLKCACTKQNETNKSTQKFYVHGHKKNGRPYCHAHFPSRWSGCSNYIPGFENIINVKILIRRSHYLLDIIISGSLHTLRILVKDRIFISREDIKNS